MPYQASVAAPIVQPAAVPVAPAAQMRDKSGDAGPLVHSDRAVGLLKLESIVDERVGPFPRVVAVIIDPSEIEPRVGNERVVAPWTAGDMVLAAAELSEYRAHRACVGSADAAG